MERVSISYNFLTEYDNTRILMCTILKHFIEYFAVKDINIISKHSRMTFLYKSAILNFLTFTVDKFESSKFQNCLRKTEILRSYFEITNSKSKSQ